MKKSVLVLTMAAAVALGRIVLVPDSAATIQAGLGMAGYGDTVLVMPDTYYENVVWPGTDGIKLYSAAGPESTVISAGGNGRVLHISSGTRATEVRGFTITGGKLASSSGAGIYCGGSPTIAGNVIYNNECHGSRNYGAGVYCGYSASPLITGNRIRGNVASDTSTWNYGGGIHLAGGMAEVCFNVIDSNRTAEGYWNYGAGIYVGSSARPVIWQNVICGNVNTLGSRGHGAGIYVGGAALVFCNLIVGNTNSSGSWNYGAGIKVNAPAEIHANTITGNTCQGGNWANGAGVFVDINDTAYVKDNIIVGNSASSGGGIYCYQPGGMAYSSYNDVWNNAGGNYVNCSAGPGDISQDPLFVAGPMGGHYLSQIAAGQGEDSPCLDAGDTLAMTTPLNLDSLLRAWTTRTDSVPDSDEPDMGYHYPAEWLVKVYELGRIQARPRVLVVPNPSRGPVRFNIGLVRPGRAGLEVTDVLGRTVSRQALDVSGPGEAVFVWGGRTDSGATLAGGVYFYRVKCNSEEVTGRIVRLR